MSLNQWPIWSSTSTWPLTSCPITTGMSKGTVSNSARKLMGFAMASMPMVTIPSRFLLPAAFYLPRGLWFFSCVVQACNAEEKWKEMPLDHIMASGHAGFLDFFLSRTLIEWICIVFEIMQAVEPLSESQWSTVEVSDNSSGVCVQGYDTQSVCNTQPLLCLSHEMPSIW